MRPCVLNVSIYTSYACGINVLILRTHVLLLRHYFRKILRGMSDLITVEIYHVTLGTRPAELFW